MAKGRIGKGVESQIENPSNEKKVSNMKLNSNVLKLIKNLKISVSAYEVKDVLTKTIGNKSSFEQSFVICDKIATLYSYDKELIGNDIDVETKIVSNSIKWNNKLDSTEFELICSDFANKKGDVFYALSCVHMVEGEIKYFSSKRNDIFQSPLHGIEKYLRNSLKTYDWIEEKLILENSNIPMLERKNILEKLYK